MINKGLESRMKNALKLTWEKKPTTEKIDKRMNTVQKKKQIATVKYRDVQPQIIKKYYLDPPV